jgi:HNH endonuclease
MARRAVTAPADGKRPVPLVSVLVGYETFKGRICELADGTVVAPGTVASLLDEALIERVVFDGPSRVIDLGGARRFTGAVRRVLEVRDRGCGHGSCDLPTERCQGDHVQPWSQGGQTNPDNGQLRCGYHNRWRWDHPDPAPPPNPDRPLDPDRPPDPDRRRRMARLEKWRADLRAKALQDPDW